MIKIPKEIEKYLLKDEIVEQSFKLRGCFVFASDRRLFQKEGKTIRDFTYNHISSIEFKSYRKWLFVVSGAILTAVGIYSLTCYDNFPWLLVILGITTFIYGFIRREELRLHIVGLSNPIIWEGQSSDLDSLFKLVREKRE